MYYSKLRAKARESLKGNWLIAIGLFVLTTIIFTLPDFIFNPNEYDFSWRDVAVILTTWLLTPITVGLTWAWIDMSRGKSISFGHLVHPFQTIFAKTIFVSFLQGLFLLLWTLLFIVPGIIKSFSYMMTFYILRDRPELSPLEVITESRKMMNGHKGEAFVLGLTFIGWLLLGVVTLGIGFLWIVPYISVTFAHFYDTIREEYEAKHA
ncbi:DUF975 family protein [Domibacillus mangrovi]|uniref:DUF975 domain-containing protein n=1 Tax=Domibacillus mangrovi TaxID=1714354 RepID=A0A1Q5P5U1_9BACI|nr:DUF975 family protein [Domibacillus mangrovi]OKL37645.1 hypothetical protein BLL40_04920 [Domibacillus mangrovi]